MAREFAKEFYRSREWQKTRSAYISYRRSVDGGMCETCHEVPGYIVHHITELTPDNINNPNITLSFDNLQYDCLECHNQIHNPRVENVPNLCRVIFSPVGDETILPPKNDGEVEGV